MRMFIAIAAILIAPQLFGFQLKDQSGTIAYSGQGQWKASCGKTGSYDSTYSFDLDQNVLTETVTLDDGTAMSYVIAAADEQNGFFHIVTSDYPPTVIGGGYCFDHVCHYTAKVGNIGVEETFAFDVNSGTLYVVGSKASLPEAKRAKDCVAAAWQAQLSQSVKRH